jgi:hypothetical protein
MSRFDSLPGRAMDLAVQVGEGIRKNVPTTAIRWIETGAALGALKTGSRMATRLVRRNPLLSVATAAAGGLLLYAARRKALQDAHGPIEGKSRRIEAKRAGGTGTATATAKRASSAASKRAASKSAPRKTTTRRSTRTKSGDAGS